MQCRSGNIFDAFHEADQEFLFARSDGRKADAAITHHQSRDPMPCSRREQRIPSRLTIVVRVDIDEARRHDFTFGIDDVSRFRIFGSDGPNLRDLPILNRDVPNKGCSPGPIDNRSASDNQIVHLVLLAFVYFPEVGRAWTGS